MDNELDGRLQRLEAALAGQGAVLEAQTRQLEQSQALLRELLSLMTQAEPEGPPLHELLAAIIGRIEHGNAIAAKTLTVLEQLGRDGRADA